MKTYSIVGLVGCGLHCIWGKRHGCDFQIAALLTTPDKKKGSEEPLD
jgi:hypothetical protein